LGGGSLAVATESTVGFHMLKSKLVSVGEASTGGSLFLGGETTSTILTSAGDSAFKFLGGSSVV
jgi:hypothetical protein